MFTLFSEIVDPLIRTRIRRLIFATLAPPVFGGVLFFLAFATADIKPAETGLISAMLAYFKFLGASMLVSAMAVGVQSVLYSLIMEFYCRRYATHPLHIVVASLLLGALAGCSIGLVFAGQLRRAIVSRSSCQEHSVAPMASPRHRPEGMGRYRRW